MDDNKLKNKDIVVKIKPEYLEKIRKKHTTYTLSKHFSMEQSIKILKGEANFNVKTLCKLCKIMKWKIPDFLEVNEKEEPKNKVED